MEWIVQESHRNGSYSGESRNIQLCPACLLWCLWLEEWCVIQTTYSLGSGSVGGQRGEEITNPAHSTCRVPCASFFTDYRGNRHLAVLGTTWFYVFATFLILNTVVWACVYHRMKLECTLPWARCIGVCLAIAEFCQGQALPGLEGPFLEVNVSKVNAGSTSTSCTLFCLVWLVCLSMFCFKLTLFGFLFVSFFFQLGKAWGDYESTLEVISTLYSLACGSNGDLDLHCKHLCALASGSEQQRKLL